MTILNGQRGDQSRRRVCILGAGAAGICALRHFHAQPYRDIFDTVCYEQTDNLGGTWNYVDEVGKDKFGLPIHSSMYRDLRTNLPLEVMEYPDFPSNSEHSFVDHRQVLKYLEDYARHFEISDLIRYRHHVIQVKRDVTSPTTKWLVTVEDLLAGRISVEVFDIVIICNGRYAAPNKPSIKGEEQFSGRILHSHDYRCAEKFEGQTVVVVGGSASGIDICLELVNHAKQVILLNRTDSHYQNLPSNVIQLKANVERFVDKKNIQLVDIDDPGKKYNFDVDCVILATGYELRLDFLDFKTVGLSLDIPNETIHGIWRQFMNIQHPSMALIGIVHRTIPFPFYNQQILFYLKLLTNQIPLPTTEQMEAEVALDNKLRKEQGYRHKEQHFLRVRDMQTYLQTLEKEANLEPIRPVIYDFYEDYVKSRPAKITHFRDIDYIFTHDKYFEKV